MSKLKCFCRVGDAFAVMGFVDLFHCCVFGPVHLQWGGVFAVGASLTYESGHNL